MVRCAFCGGRRLDAAPGFSANPHRPVPTQSNTMNTRPDHSEANEAWREVRYEYTPNLPEILAHLHASLLVTTYQAGKLLVLGTCDGHLTISFSSYEQAMGLAADSDRLAIGSRRQIHFLTAAHECTRQSAGNLAKHDGCFVPRSSHYTGNVHGHDLAWGADGLWVVNTLFSCLCTLHDSYNFVPRWRPPFVTQLIDQDRCHLNGLAMDAGRPRYVSALAESNEPAGWRPRKASSGCVIDVASGETVARGFAMPHSPRIYHEQLWLLDSGTGRLGIVDVASGRFDAVESVPGYTRGLAFAGSFAFVGLSRIRETNIFGGLPIAEHHQDLRCGIAVIDLVSGNTVSVFQFHSGVEEIYAVDVVPSIQNPMVAGSTEDEQEHDVWIVPPPDRPPPAITAILPWFAPRPAPSADVLPPERSGPQWAARAAAMHREGNLVAAVTSYEHAIPLSLKPAPLWVDLGNVRQEQGNQEEALACYFRAVDIDPDCVPARQNLGYLLFNRGEPEKSLEQYQHLLRLSPSPMNRLLAATVLPVVYPSVDDLRHWRTRLESELQRMEADGIQIDAADQLVPTAFFVAYQGGNDLPVMQARGRLIQGIRDLPATGGARDSVAAVATGPPTRRFGRVRRRVGFMSAYFRDHTIGRLNVGRIEHLDKQRFEVTVAFAAHGGDEMTERFRQAADRFVMLSRDPSSARQQLWELDLDILIFADVGMDALTSTLAYSRMAPIQCVTWGHPDTTGSPTMDYFLSSHLLEIPDAQSHYSEQLVRLPLLATYYERPRRSGSTRSRDYFQLDANRHIYLCPQTLFKFHPEYDEVLAGILRADSKGEIVLLEGRVPEWTRRLQQRWRRTIPDAAQRVRFLPAQPRDDFLSLLECADVVIDPLHFGGGNSSYETLGQGVPLVTLPGDYLRSRITAALYRKMQFEALIAESPQHYVQLALRLAQDRAYRDQITQEICRRRDVLFEDSAEVRCLEEWLDSV